MFWFEWLLVSLGHIGLSCVLFNHVHAHASPRPSSWYPRKLTEKFIFLFAFLLVPLSICAIALRTGTPKPYPFWFASYTLLARWTAVFFIFRWLYRSITRKLPLNATPTNAEWFDVQDHVQQSLLHGRKARWLGWVPGNEVTHLKIEHWRFQFDDLPDALEGFKICQLSDLHFTGLIGPEYFAQIVERVNLESPDLIVLTGDIVDVDRCVPWIPNVLGKLYAKHGIYFVLGNHDLLVSDQVQYRECFTKLGFVSAADGNWKSIDVGDACLFVAGNEMPWYDGAKSLPAVPSSPKPKFSILLSHSPDQIGWAIHRGVDLMFAGHTHGGQIRLPLVGPIIAPSKFGIKYASGTFKVRDILMHVSRGLSGDEPIRINCPPELGFFTLTKRSNS